MRRVFFDHINMGNPSQTNTIKTSPTNERPLCIYPVVPTKHIASTPMRSFQAKIQFSCLFLLCFYAAKASNENVHLTTQEGGVFVIPEGLETQPFTVKSHRTWATKRKTTPNRKPTVFAAFAGGPGVKVITSFQEGVPDAESLLQQMSRPFFSSGGRV